LEHTLVERRKIVSDCEPVEDVHLAAHPHIGAAFGTATRVMSSQLQCRKCGGSRTRVVGQSAVPAGALVTCEACGYSSLVADAAPPPPDAETRRVERLVKMVVDDKRMTCELRAVTRTAAGWQVTARVREREVVRFELKGGGFAAMRAEIERALGAR